MALTGGGRVIVPPPRTAKEVCDAAAVQGIALKEEEALRFMDYFEARGWHDRYGKPYADWRRLIREHKEIIKRWENGNGNANQGAGGARRRIDNGGPSRCGDPRNKPEDFKPEWLWYHSAAGGGGDGANQGVVRG